LKVALVEQDEIGGTCINNGCSPTKTMVASAKVAETVRRAGDFGIHVEGFSVNQKAIRDRKQHIVDLFRGGAESGLKKAENVEIVKGRATFKSPMVLQVSDGESRELQGDRIFINTGSHTVIPDIEGLASQPYLTSTSIMELEETPEHLLILGGGYIGLEFGQMFRRFGSKVTILDRNARLVPKEDEDVCEEISNIFHTSRISTIFNATACKISGGRGRITIHYKDQSGTPRAVTGSHLLVAAGRAPTSDN